MQRRFNRTNNSLLVSGQSLIEVLVSLAIVIVLAISLVTTLLITQRTARTARNNTQASKLAQEYIETTRIIRDRKGFSVFKTPTGDLISGTCYLPDTSNTVSPDNWQLNTCTLPGETKTLGSTIFLRRLEIVPGPATGPSDPDITDKIKVTAKVTYYDGEIAKTISSSTIFSNCVSPTALCN